jgi:tRNA dimethylallyltransferase
LKRGKTPIICGGTGQYIDVLIYTTQLPAVPPNKKLREELEGLSTETLVARLTARDPSRAAAIDIHNRVRLIRALEVVESLGTVPVQAAPTLRYRTKLYLMNPSRELLRARITKRLEKRLTEGMIEEVESVMEKGYTSDQMKRFGLEYVTIGKYLEGTLSETEMRTELINKSMQYAKRQQTWNKKYAPIAEIIEVRE